MDTKDSGRATRVKREELTKFCTKAERTCSKQFEHYRQAFKPLTMNENPQMRICDVCSSAENERKDFIMQCKLCCVLVHQSCYGARWNTHDEDFLCFRCAYLINNNQDWQTIRCAFCPEIKGVMKPIYEDLAQEWCHRQCGNYIVECWWNDDTFGWLVISSNFIWKTKERCWLCDSTQGRVIMCDRKGCKFRAHVTCCIKAGVIRAAEDMQDQSERQGYKDSSYVLCVYCIEHLKPNRAQCQKAYEFFEGFTRTESWSHFFEGSTAIDTYMNSQEYVGKVRMAYLGKKALKQGFSRDNSQSHDVAQKRTEKPQSMEEEWSIPKDFLMVQFFCDEPIVDLSGEGSNIENFALEHYNSPSEYRNLLKYGMNINDPDNLLPEHNQLKQMISLAIQSQPTPNTHANSKQRYNTKPIPRAVKRGLPSTEDNEQPACPPFVPMQQERQFSEADTLVAPRPLLQQTSSQQQHFVQHPQSQPLPAPQQAASTEAESFQPSVKPTSKAHSLLAPPPAPEIKKKQKLLNPNEKTVPAPNKELSKLFKQLGATVSQIKFRKAAKRLEEDDDEEIPSPVPAKLSSAFDLSIVLHSLKRAKEFHLQS